MTTLPDQRKKGLRVIPRNVWALGLTSFFTDISSEMVLNLVPLFLFNVLGVKTSLIGLIEGIAETTASLLKIFSGYISDRIGQRKWLTASGYGLSTISKPLLYFATSWAGVLGVRFADRTGKGIRTAPRDALIADSVKENQRGLSFGLHRAADTGGAMLGLIIAALVIWGAQAGLHTLTRDTFQKVVLLSIIPGVLGVLSVPISAGFRYPLQSFLIHPGTVHPGKFVGCLLNLASSGTRFECVAGHGNADHLQLDLRAHLHPCRSALRPGWAA